MPPKRKTTTAAKTASAAKAAATTKKDVGTASDEATLEDHTTEETPPETKQATKKTKKNTKAFHVFVVNNNKFRMFTDLTRAEKFGTEFRSIINQTRTFNTIAAAKKFKSTFFKDTPATPDGSLTSASSTTPGSVSPENQSRLNDIKKRMMKNAPKNKIVMHWMTTTSCSAFFVIIRFYNRSGYEQW